MASAIGLSTLATIGWLLHPSPPTVAEQIERPWKVAGLLSWPNARSAGNETPKEGSP